MIIKEIRSSIYFDKNVAGVILLQLVGVLASIIHLYLILSKMSSDSRILWLSIQNLLGGLAISDLGVTAVCQRFIGFSKDKPEMTTRVGSVMREVRPLFKFQLGFLFIISIIYSLVLRNEISLLLIVLTCLLALLQIHKNRIGAAVNNLRTPLYQQFLDVLVNLAKLLFIWLYYDRIVLLISLWIILVLVELVIMYKAIPKAKEVIDYSDISQKITQNIARTGAMNMGGFFMSYLSAILVLSFSDKIFVDSFLLTHRILLIFMGISQSAVYYFLPKMLNLYTVKRYADLKTLARKNMVLASCIFVMGISFLLLLDYSGLYELNLLSFNYLIVMTIISLFEIFNVINTSMVLLKDSQPFLPATIMSLVAQSIIYILAFELDNLLLFILAPLIGSMFTTWRRSYTLMRRDKRLRYV